ncbi:MAG: SMP-30/gluconolactonase/LRE family protein [Ginsengibacter sp.]
MKLKLINLLFILIMISDSNAQTNNNDSPSNSHSVTADGATLQLISNQFSFTEGPATDKEGNVFFTDQPNNKIWKYDTDGNLSVFLSDAGRSNGMFFDKNGNLISCADEHDQLWSISPEGKITVLVKGFHGHLFNGPNDVFVTPAGAIYFTDPYYQRPYWTRKAPDLDGQKVYFLKEKNDAIVVVDDLKKPNGIVGTPDGKYLYIADIEGNKTYKYVIAEDGMLKDQRVFTDQGSDGMTMDNEGNIYLTGNGVTVYNPEGKKIEHIDVPAKWTGNITFWGKERNYLFITASENIFIIKMKVKGVF